MNITAPYRALTHKYFIPGKINKVIFLCSIHEQALKKIRKIIVNTIARNLIIRILSEKTQLCKSKENSFSLTLRIVLTADLDFASSGYFNIILMSHTDIVRSVLQRSMQSPTKQVRPARMWEKIFAALNPVSNLGKDTLNSDWRIQKLFSVSRGKWQLKSRTRTSL